jgi:drug/metabolite transporter (DMT)-like permease
MINNQSKGIWWAATAAVISGVAVFANSLVVRGIDPMVHTTIKNTFVGIAVIGLILLTRERQAVKQITKRQWLKLVGIAVIGGSLAFGLFFTGLKQIGATEGQILNKTLVIWVMLLAIPLLKEKITKPMVLGVILVYASSFLGGGWRSAQLMTGHFLVMAATLMWAAETILVKKTLNEVPVNIAVGARMGLGSLILIGWLLVTGRAPLVTALSVTQWGLLLLVGMILFGYVMSWYRALKFAPAVLVSSIMAGAVIVTTMLNSLFVSHGFSLTNLMQAGVLILGCGLVGWGAQLTRVLPKISFKKSVLS